MHAILALILSVGIRRWRSGTRAPSSGLSYWEASQPWQPPQSPQHRQNNGLSGSNVWNGDLGETERLTQLCFRR